MSYQPIACGPCPTGVNMTAHQGLRGFLTLWIVVFHSSFYSESNWLRLQGSVWMTQFFLLSGFALGVGYLDQCQPGGTSDWPTFYRNRIIRIFPLFYLINILAVPTIFTGWGTISSYNGTNTVDLLKTGVMSLIPIHTWILDVFGIGFIYPGWFICTLLFMYCCFPLFGRLVHCIGDRLFLWSWIFNVLQIVLAITVLFTIDFKKATMTPYTRFPVFLMGMLAAQDCLQTNHPDRNYQSIFTPSLLCGDQSDKRDPRAWARKVDALTIFLSIFFVYYMVLDTLVGSRYIQFGSCGGFWLQIFAAWPMMVWMVAMTRDGGHSWTTRFFLTRPLAFVGQHSMAIYLIHQPLISYWTALWNIVILDHSMVTYLDPVTGLNTTVASHFLTMDEHKAIGYLAPSWTVCLILPSAVLVGWLLSRFVDKPCRTCLRTRTRQVSCSPREAVKHFPVDE
jgi:peptidoglycan/LPS O-acetylase OafA/YrhL